MKILFVSHIANFQKFNRPYMRWFREQGWEVHYASFDDEPVTDVDFFHKIDFRRNPFHPQNLKAFFQMVRLYKKYRFEIVHCHSPIGGIVARAAAVFFPKIKILYTVHGFHFFKGAPRKNFLLYRTIEKLFARRTDALVTINEEDFESAKKFRLRRGGTIYHIPGVGVDTDLFFNATPIPKKELGIPENAFVVVTVAELIKRKNYRTSLRAFAKADLPNSYYLICGSVLLDGNAEISAIEELIDALGIRDRVIFAGYRRDVARLLKASDIFLLASYQEGLCISIVEAMASGLPVVASRIRGNTELIAENGYLCEVSDVDAYAHALKKLYEDPDLREKTRENSVKSSKRYDTRETVRQMGEIYRRYM
ncbi:MAG: glycosyltransferase family 4 protein [Bacteroides sp.]|nr:glycosyltransferase family 4 protein [Eubacterium sp.]MCM1417960.1 glycosyltransferase family 4 protein [Roseburia sp.]MCM1461793.1 glycosyltransferase family 4 protein [Bacteroides sp.]